MGKSSFLLTTSITSLHTNISHKVYFRVTMASGGLPPVGNITPADLGSILSNIASLPQGYLDKTLDVEVQLGVQTPQSLPKPTKATTNVLAQKLQAPARPEEVTNLGVSKVGNNVCCACFGTTAHSCVQCSLPCHNPANSWSDDLGQSQKCSVQDPNSTEEADHLCRNCAKLPHVSPRIEADTPMLTDDDGDFGFVPSDGESDILTQKYVEPKKAAAAPVLDVRTLPLPQTSTLPKWAEPLPPPFPLTVRFESSQSQLRNVRDKNISFGDIHLRGTLIDLLPQILRNGTEKENSPLQLARPRD